MCKNLLLNYYIKEKQREKRQFSNCMTGAKLASSKISQTRTFGITGWGQNADKYTKKLKLHFMFNKIRAKMHTV